MKSVKEGANKRVVHTHFTMKYVKMQFLDISLIKEGANKRVVHTHFTIKYVKMQFLDISLIVFFSVFSFATDQPKTIS